jgi:hypothetical protein
VLHTGTVSSPNPSCARNPSGKGSAPAPAVRFPPLDNGFVPVPTEVGGDWRPAAALERGEAVPLSHRGEPLETQRSGGQQERRRRRRPRVHRWQSPWRSSLSRVGEERVAQVKETVKR